MLVTKTIKLSRMKIFSIFVSIVITLEISTKHYTHSNGVGLHLTEKQKGTISPIM